MIPALVFEELQERKSRECNVIMFNVPEAVDPCNATHDVNLVAELLSSIAPSDQIKKVIRLGKRNDSKPRPTKIILGSSDVARNIVKHRRHIQKGIHLKSDETPRQRQYMTALRKELDRRKQLGEIDLIIKYIGGIPRIIRKPPAAEN